MGTTAEKLTYLNTTKQLIKESINLTDANITTQPFRQYATILKHRLPEIVGDPSIIWNNYEHVTGSGTSFNITAYNSIIDYSLKGNTTQNGTPTPDAPVPVNVVSGDNEIKVCNKNLLQLINFSANNQKTYTNNNITATLNDDGTITLNGTASGNTDFYLTNNNVNSTNKKMILFAIDGTFTGNTSAYCYTAGNQNGKYVTLSEIGNGEVNLVENKTYISFEIYVRNGNVYNNARFGIMVVDKDLTINTYEPYTGATYPINLGDIELCKIGDYQDYIYKDNGKWYLHKEIGKVVLDGSENWTTRQGETSYAYMLQDVFDKYKTTGLCNYFRFIEGGATGSQITECIASANTNGTASIFTNNSSLNTLANFKTWLSTHNLKVYYVLATPTNTEITDVNLIYQLNGVSLITGLNNISVSGELPATLDLTALKYE